MKKSIVIIGLVIAMQGQAQQLSERIANTVMTVWKDSLNGKWSYDQGVILKGIEGLWHNTADGKYFRYMQKSMDFFVGKDGSIKGYKLEDYNIDNVLCGRILLTLFKVTNDQKYYKAAAQLRSQIQQQPRTNEGGFWHKKRYPYQMWLDGLYMGQPFYAEWAQLFREDTVFNDITNQFVWMEQHARDAKTGLLYHGWDESKEQQWANKTTGLSPNFWARAMGWYGMALVDALPYFPEDHPGRKKLIDILNRFATAVKKVQDPKTGLWWDILNFPDRKGNYLEASASSMFVYAIAKGVRLGYLPSTFLPVAVKGYDGIQKQFIKVDDAGLTVLDGTVSVSGLGGTPYRDGSYEYYISEKVIRNDAKGVGAVLLAADEMELLPDLNKGKGKTVVLDNFFNNEFTKDVTGATVPYHYIWSEMDNNGYQLLGHVFNRYGVKTKTLQQAPTAQTLKGADFYLIVDPDTQKETKEPNYIQKEHIDAIENWVKAGGVLLLFGNDTGNVEFPHFNELAKRFGFQFKYESLNRVQGNKYEQGTFEVPADHPIFKTAKKIYIKEYASQTVNGPAKAAFTQGETVVMSVAKVGKGTVFAVGDPWFYNEYLDGRKLPLELENYKAACDLVQWAIKQVPAKK